ncbi:glycosyltransferase family 2 protein [Yersinia enterocolitica]|uniref:glycosyltransferase family 2 protein n=1 Tax=Yersinia enterocolitica TaxID=630 RepID=UPI0029334CA3|nr:glycosyltransferase family 2 protein [Yersinia enterocolitica]HEC1640645.1 glycosyltransferase family 2 protein [Yersinia enterocolitica]HEN3296752.1 glycosyltransferase family 2 protein [Yersinia enterocolitica]
MNSNIIIGQSSIEEDIILTIAIPTYKRFSLLKETLRSAINLKFTIQVEIIVVDNDPNNIDLAIKEMSDFSAYNFKYYKNESNYGAAGNWNRCLELAKGKLITILHDDDLLCENFPVELEKYLSNYKGIDNIPMIGFGAYILEQRDKSNKVEINYLYRILRNIYNKYRYFTISNERKKIVDLQDYIFNSYYVSTLAVIMDRQKALAINGFDNYWYPIIDYEFYIRWIQSYGDVVYINTKVSKYRILDNSCMQSEVITGVIDKNYELRMKVFNEERNLIGVNNFAKIMREIEKTTWSINWRNNAEYKMSMFDTFKLIFLKLKCLLSIKKNKVKKKLQGTAFNFLS